MEKLSELFSSDIDNLKIEVIKKRLIQSSLSLSAVCMIGSAALAPNQPKQFLLWQLGLSSIFSAAGAYVSHAREDVESRYQSFLKLNREKAKKVVSYSFDFDLKLAKISSDLNIAQQVRKLPLTAQQRYCEEMGLHGLIHLPIQQVENETGFTTIDVKPSINTPKERSESTRRIVDGDKDLALKHMSKTYPEYFKYNPQWIVDIAKSSVESDLSKRQNHHLYFCGKSQSGKTTLASVFINLMNEYSETPTDTHCHDPKMIQGGLEISSWLCHIDEKINSFENTQTWLDHSTTQVKEHFDTVSKLGYSRLNEAHELIMIQDEIDTLYGRGDGYGEIVDKKLSKKLQSAWLSWVKVLKGCKGHFVAMGQSPLTTENGFSRPTLGEFCFVCINKSTAKYILNNPKDFLDDPSEEILEFFSKTVDLLDSMGIRFALVRPTQGKPFIGIIPNFNTQPSSNTETEDNETGFTEDTEQVEEDLLPEDGEVETIVEDKFYESDKKSTETGFTKSDDAPVFINAYEDYMVEWLKLCLEKSGTLPNDETIKQVWEDKTGIPIKDEIVLQGLIETLLAKINLKK